jgi:hypothetical protein
MKRLIRGIGRQELRTEATTQRILDKCDSIIGVLQEGIAASPSPIASQLHADSLCRRCPHQNRIRQNPNVPRNPAEVYCPAHDYYFNAHVPVESCARYHRDVIQPNPPWERPARSITEVGLPPIPEGSICESCPHRATRHYARGESYVHCNSPEQLHTVAIGATIYSCTSYPPERVQRAVVYDTPRESQCRTCLHGTRLVRSSVNPERGAVCRQADRRFTTDAVIQQCHDYRAF